METLPLICSIILCVIGVLTFIVGMTSRAKSDGAMMQKLNQTVDGIEDLKTDVKEIKSNQHQTDLKLLSHEEQIKTLFHTLNGNREISQSLITIMNILNQKISGVNENVQGKQSS